MKRVVEAVRRVSTAASSLWHKHRVATGIGLVASLASIASCFVDFAELRRADHVPGNPAIPCTTLDYEVEWLLIKFSTCIDKEKEAADKRVQFWASLISIKDDQQQLEGSGDLESFLNHLDRTQQQGDVMIRSLMSSFERDRNADDCFSADDYKRLDQALSGDKIYICDKDLRLADQSRYEAYKALDGDLDRSSIEARVALDRIERAENDYFNALKNCLEFSKKNLCGG